MQRKSWMLIGITALALAGCESAVITDVRPAGSGSNANGDTSLQASDRQGPGESAKPNTVETDHMRIEDHVNE